MISTILCDLDGVVWLAHRPIEGATEAIAALQAAGRRVMFVTNNSAATVATQESALAAIGVDATGSVVSSRQSRASAFECGGNSRELAWSRGQFRAAGSVLGEESVKAGASVRIGALAESPVEAREQAVLVVGSPRSSEQTGARDQCRPSAGSGVAPHQAEQLDQVPVVPEEVLKSRDALGARRIRIDARHLCREASMHVLSDQRQQLGRQFAFILL
jgi:hypothetical protein